jgi:hypothetical protein
LKTVQEKKTYSASNRKNIHKDIFSNFLLAVQ